MFTRIHHVAIAVHQIDQALRFYRDTLGLSVRCEAALVNQGVRAALLSVGTDEIELLEPLDPDGGVARFLARRGEGLHHICLETPDIVAAVAAAQGAGLPLIDRAPRPGLAGRIAFLHPKASAGVLIEMAQIGEEGAHPRIDETGEPPLGFETIYIVAKDPAGAVEDYVRNFGGRVVSNDGKPRLWGSAITLRIGPSRMTFLSPCPVGAPIPMEPPLAVREEGLFGICLRLADGACGLRRLEGRGVRLRTKQETGGSAFAAIDPPQAHGVALFLVPSAAKDG